MPLSPHSPLALAELAVFAGCRRKELDSIASLVTPVTVEAGTVLMREGSSASEAFVVLDGHVDVTCGDGAAARHLGIATVGDPLGEMSILRRTRRSATVTAATPTTLYVATPAELSAIMRVAPVVEARLYAIAVQRESSNRAA